MRNMHDEDEDHVMTGFEREAVAGAAAGSGQH